MTPFEASQAEKLILKSPKIPFIGQTFNLELILTHNPVGITHQGVKMLLVFSEYYNYWFFSRWIVH